MRYRTLPVAVLAVLALFAIAFSPAGGAASGYPATVTVSPIPGNGLTPFTPISLTVAQLATLPQQTITVNINGTPTTETGPLVSAVLSHAGLTFLSSTACKNDELRYAVSATSASGAGAVITNGELDTGFGNRPAILSIDENGSTLTAPRLVVPNDANDARDIQNVIDLTVSRAAPQLANTATSGCTPPPFTAPVTAPAVGSILINGDVANPETLTFAQLGSSMFPQITQMDSFQGPGGITHVTEVGPSLAAVLATAEPNFGPGNDDLNFYVQVTSWEDGYAATVSWYEISVTGDNDGSLLSLHENGTSLASVGPRLTVPGDAKGGRYVSGASVVTVFRVPPVSPTPGSGPNLAGKNLKGAQLGGAFLVGATLDGANLNGANLAGAYLDAASLVGANLNKADLAGAFLNGANLSGANLNSVDLTGANLTGANLTGANLNKVTWWNTTCPDGSNSIADGGSCAGHL